MLRELVLAIGIPLVLLLLAVLALEQWRDQLRSPPPRTSRDRDWALRHPHDLPLACHCRGDGGPLLALS
jgi:hypothetical protein